MLVIPQVLSQIVYGALPHTLLLLQYISKVTIHTDKFTRK
jgi:hypothetical protein